VIPLFNDRPRAVGKQDSLFFDVTRLQFAAENAESVSDVRESSTYYCYACFWNPTCLREKDSSSRAVIAEGFVNFDVMLREVHVRFITTVCLIGSADFSNYWRFVNNPTEIHVEIDTLNLRRKYVF
jgi:hypothetical protein